MLGAASRVPVAGLITPAAGMWVSLHLIGFAAGLVCLWGVTGLKVLVLMIRWMSLGLHARRIFGAWRRASMALIGWPWFCNRLGYSPKAPALVQLRIGS